MKLKLWQVTDGNITVETEGLYPFRGQARVIVSVEEEISFALYLRIPA